METQRDGLKKINDEREQLYNETANALKKEWGGNFDRNKALVAKAIDKFGGEAVKEYFNKNARIGNSPEITKLLYSMVSAMSEDIIEKGGVSDLVTTPAQAKARLAEIDATSKLPLDQQHPYWKGDKDAVKEYQELIRIAEGVA